MFLRPHEKSLILADYKRMLNSAEAMDLVIAHRVPVNPVTNSVYGTTTADSWTTVEIETKAIQKLVHPKNEDILRWGILAAGDSIFYIGIEVDLASIRFDTVVINAGNELWYPVPRKEKQFYEHIAWRIGNTQVGQCIAAKLKQ